jgi:hypothetical protein
MAREVWTVRFEVDVGESAPGQFGIDCLSKGGPAAAVENTDEYILNAQPDGLHRHRHCNCHVLLPWQLVGREPSEARP